MAFTPADRLTNRSFIGLLIAQFFAAFNDQTIHAAAMFFAFHQQLMTEATAISLMPILFYAPWAIFCTLAGYLSDRFSKQWSLIFWKFVEVVICGLALVGFYLGAVHGLKVGPILVLACVFGMGMQSAFLVPAKYGVMPEILQPQLLSRGNGLLESLSFLAVILGTVNGGVLSAFFKGNETVIGIVLFALAVVGALASLMIRWMPAANPTRPFPRFVYGPLLPSLRTLFGSRPLLLATIGIAFFTFVVAFMRATVYMFGESQTPRWREDETSYIVGCTALGIGLGAPLAGWLSGRKIELGLIPLGGLGMSAAAFVVSLSLHWIPGLVACIILIGFFTGFYLVPLYTLLQHRAPRDSKGDAVAISNFVNVTGAILASLVFYMCTRAFALLGLAEPIVFDAGTPAQLKQIAFDSGRPTEFVLVNQKPVRANSRVDIQTSPMIPISVDPNAPVDVMLYQVKHNGSQLYFLTAPNEPPPIELDKSELPGYLFAGCGLITLLTLGALITILPDLPGRAVWVLRTIRRPRLRAAGTHHVPLKGPVLLPSNAAGWDDLRQIISATDRPVRTIVDEAGVAQAARTLARGGAVLLAESAWSMAAKLNEEVPSAVVVPVMIHFDETHGQPRVAFGLPGPMPDDLPAAIAAAREVPDEDDESSHG